MDWTNADARQQALDAALDSIGREDGEEWTLDEDKILQVKRLGVTRTSYLQNDLMPNEPDLPGAIGFRALQMRKSISLIADTLRASKPVDEDDDWLLAMHKAALAVSAGLDEQIARHYQGLIDADRAKAIDRALPYNRYNWRENELANTLPDCWHGIPIEGPSIEMANEQWQPSEDLVNTLPDDWFDKPAEEKSGYGDFGNEVFEELRQRKFEPKIVFNGIPIEGQHGVTDSGIVEVATHYRRKLIKLGLLSPGIEDEV